MIQSATPFNGLCAVGFLARASYALARTPVLALFAASLGAGPEAIGFCVAISIKFELTTFVEVNLH
jgi:hypothetical protein